MSVHCFTPLLGKRLRITKLDSCGRLPAAAAADSFVVTDGFITVNISVEIEDGVEIIQKNAAGALCVNEKFSNSFKRLNVEAELCGVNPAVLGLTTNAEGYLDYAGDTAGITMGEGEINKWFALELWTGLSGMPCPEGDEIPSGYMILPFVAAGNVNNIEVGGENAINLSMTGAYTKGSNNWGRGPYNVVYNASSVASPLPTALDPFDHFLLMDTALAFPPASCDLQAMIAYTTTTTTTTAG